MAEVELKDVYELVDRSRKEQAEAIGKVHSDVVEVKVQVGKLETRLDDHSSRIGNLEKNYQDLVRKALVRGSEAGGVVGFLSAALLRVIELLASRP